MRVAGLMLLPMMHVLQHEVNKANEPTSVGEQNGIGFGLFWANSVTPVDLVLVIV